MTPEPRSEGGGARQCAAMPFRAGELRRGAPDILLVTSRDTRRWIIPKGKVDLGMTPRQAAAQEALEEAGVFGMIGDEPIGSFTYAKRWTDGSIEMIAADVFSLDVAKELVEWKEQHERERRWFSREEAAVAVDEPELKAIIAGFDPFG